MRTPTWSAGSSRAQRLARPGRRGAAAGFSLLELLVVLVLLAGLTALALPRLEIGATVTARATARSVAAGLRKTRSLAITAQRPADLHLDLDTHTLALPGETVRRKLAPGLDYELTAAQSLASGNGGAIRFYPDGSSTGGRLSVSTPDETLHVDVEWFTGRVRILDERRRAR